MKNSFLLLFSLCLSACAASNPHLNLIQGTNIVLRSTNTASGVDVEINAASIAGGSGEVTTAQLLVVSNQAAAKLSSTNGAAIGSLTLNGLNVATNEPPNYVAGLNTSLVTNGATVSINAVVTSSNVFNDPLITGNLTVSNGNALYFAPSDFGSTPSVTGQGSPAGFVVHSSTNGWTASNAADSPWRYVNDRGLYWGWNGAGFPGYSSNDVQLISGIETPWFNPSLSPVLERWERYYNTNGTGFRTPWGYDINLDNNAVSMFIGANSLVFRDDGLTNHITFAPRLGLWTFTSPQVSFTGNTNKWLIASGGTGLIGNPSAETNYLFEGLNQNAKVILFKSQSVAGSDLRLGFGTEPSTKWLRWQGTNASSDKYSFEYQDAFGGWHGFGETNFVGLRVTNRLDSGSVVTPNSIEFPTLEAGNLLIQSYALNNNWIGDNLYYNGGYKLRSAGSAQAITFRDGQIYGSFAASGSAGATVTPAIGWSLAFAEKSMRLGSNWVVGWGNTDSANNLISALDTTITRIAPATVSLGNGAATGNGNLIASNMVAKGNVGIGTNAPAFNLEVVGTNSTRGRILLNGTNIEAQISAQIAAESGTGGGDVSTAELEATFQSSTNFARAGTNSSGTAVFGWVKGTNANFTNLYAGQVTADTMTINTLSTTNLLATNSAFYGTTLASGAFVVNGDAVITNATSDGSLTVQGATDLQGGVTVAGEVDARSLISGSSLKITNSATFQTLPQFGNTNLATETFVRGLFDGAGVAYYSTTNIAVGFTNADVAGGSNFLFNTVAPFPAVRVYLAAAIPNGTYFGSVTTSNRLLQLNSSAVANLSLMSSNGSGTAGPAVKSEVYISYDGTNWFGDWDGTPQYVTEAITNTYSWVIPNPYYVSTNSQGFFVQMRQKMVTQTTPAAADVWVMLGTNATHLSLSGASPDSGNVYASANNVFTGSNYFSLPLVTPTVLVTNGNLVTATNDAFAYSRSVSNSTYTVSSNISLALANAAMQTATNYANSKTPSIVTNSIWIPAGAMAPYGGSTADGGRNGATAGSFTNVAAVDTWDMDDTTNECVGFTWQPGADFAGDLVTSIYWLTTNSLNGASNVVWDAGVSLLASNALITANSWQTNATHRFWSSNSVQVAKLPKITITGQTYDTLLSFRLGRLGTNAADVAVGDARLLGARISFTRTNLFGGH